MKTIFLIRHAKSSWSFGNLRDIDRPLNERGLRDAPFMAELLYKQETRPDGIIKSPAVRITQTVEPFIQIFAMTDNNIITESSVYHGSLYDLLEAIQQTPDEWETLFLFCHNPGITYLAQYLGGQNVDNVPTCGVVKVISEADKWAYIDSNNSKVSGFYYPKQYFHD